MTSQHAAASAKAPASTGIAGAPGARGYWYRGKERGAPDPPEAGAVRNALRGQRISIVASHIRALTVRRSHRLAQALQDGLTVSVLAEAAGLPRGVVREAGISLAELHPLGSQPMSTC